MEKKQNEVLIDFDSNNPKYKQLVKVLRRMMKDGHFQPGEKIPSENTLIKDLGVSRNTIRQAFQELEKDGLLYKRKGQGTFYAGEDNVTKRQRTMLFGVIVPFLTASIYPTILRGVEKVADERHYNMIVGYSEASLDKEYRLVQQMLEKGIEGIVIEPTFSATITDDSKIFRLLHNLKIPVVIMDNLIPRLDRSYVTIDDCMGGYEATKYLIRKGHKKIACIYKEEVQAGVKRKEGYLQALSEHAIPVKEDYVLGFHEEDEKNMPGRLLGRQLLALGEARPTAIFGYNDEIAFQSYMAIREKGLVVGEDVSVMGFDDSSLAAAAEVPMTTMAHPKFYMGKWAADILFDEIDSRDGAVPSRIHIRPSLVERSSVRTLADEQ